MITLQDVFYLNEKYKTDNYSSQVGRQLSLLIDVLAIEAEQEKITATPNLSVHKSNQEE